MVVVRVVGAEARGEHTLTGIPSSLHSVYCQPISRDLL
jgi:hypothetical protein